MPVLDRSKCKNFNEIKINQNGWNEKHIKNIDNFYRKSEYFDVYYKDLEKFYNRNYIKFIDLSVDLIKYFCGVLDINTDIVYSSEICKDVDLTGMDKIFYILEQLKADTYISSDGPGSRRYIKEEDFNDKNIKLIWQNFEHPTYKQMYGDFISHLSVIDLIFNNGGEISKEVIK